MRRGGWIAGGAALVLVAATVVTISLVPAGCRSGAVPGPDGMAVRVDGAAGTFGEVTDRRDFWQAGRLNEVGLEVAPR